MFLKGLNEIVHPDKSPSRKKRHDISSYEQELRNKLNGLSSPIRSQSITPTTSPVLPHSPLTSRQQQQQQLPPVNSTHSPQATNNEKTKPRPLTKRLGLKRTLMDKLKITKNSR